MGCGLGKTHDTNSIVLSHATPPANDRRGVSTPVIGGRTSNLRKQRHPHHPSQDSKPHPYKLLAPTKIIEKQSSRSLSNTSTPPSKRTRKHSLFQRPYQVHLPATLHSPVVTQLSPNNMVLGIDIGSEAAVVATVGKGTITIIRNDISERLTPSLVAFSSTVRSIGDPALAQLKSNFANTCRGFKNLLGVPASEFSKLQPTLVENELAKVEPLDDGTLGYRVEYNGQNLALSASRVYAAMLTRLRHIAEDYTGKPVTEVVVSCPGWFTDANRSALFTATQIAGLDCLSIISETTAICLDYGIYRARSLASHPVPYRTCFVTMGHTNTSVCVADFTSERLEILIEKSEQNLGGQAMTRLLMQYVAEEFRKQHKIDPLEKPKNRLKVEEMAGKCKKVLSANKEAFFGIECLVDDYDCNLTITRETFESICAETLRPGVKAIIESVFGSSGISMESVRDIEISGGGTRVPWVQEVITEVMGGMPISRTLSADECVARGCALQAAMSSRNFRVIEFGCMEKIFHSISMSWAKSSHEPPLIIEDGLPPSDPRSQQRVLPVESAGDECTAVIMDYGSYINTIKRVTFNRDDNFSVSFHYTHPERLPSGTNPKLAECKIKFTRPPPTDANVQVHISCCLSYYGIFKIHQIVARHAVKVVQDVKVRKPFVPPQTASPQKASENCEDTTNKEATQQIDPEVAPEAPQFVYEKRVTEKYETLPTEHSVTMSSVTFSQKDIMNFHEAELNMNESDTNYKDRMAAMNACETKLYEIRNGMSANLQHFLTDEQKQNISDCCTNCENWLYDNQESSKSEYLEKLLMLEDLVRPAVELETEDQQRESTVTWALLTIQECRSMLSKATDQLPVDTSQQLEKVDALEKWINQMNQDQSTRLKCEKPLFTTRDLQQKIKYIFDETQQLLNGPQQPAEGVDTEPGTNSCDKNAQPFVEEPEKMDVE